jgi:hypothetical protein
MHRLTNAVPILVAAFAMACAEPSRPTAPKSGASFSAKASGGDTPVTTTVADADTTIAPTLQIQSDKLGAYKNSGTLTSVIQGIGAWVLDSYDPSRSTRTVYLDFSQPIAGSGPNGGNPVAIPSTTYKVHAISKCNLYNNSMLTLAPGATMPCPLHLGDVYSGGIKYAVQMNPYTSSADTAYSETNYANITCVYPASGAGPCTQWRITPSGTFTAPNGTLKYRNVGKLLKFVTSGKTTTTVNQGDFYFSFAIGVTNP